MKEIAMSYEALTEHADYFGLPVRVTDDGIAVVEDGPVRLTAPAELRDQKGVHSSSTPFGEPAPSTLDQALADRDIRSYVAALADQWAPCQCADGLPCSRIHRPPGESPRGALLRRLKAAREDPIGVEEDSEFGGIAHTVYGVLPADLDTLIRLLETTPIGATA